MKNLALPRVRKMQPYKPPLGSRRGYGGMLLDFNERTMPHANGVVAAIEKGLNPVSLNTYPEYSGLEELIADYAGVNPNQVMLVNGSDQGIEVIFRTFTDTGQKVIIPGPSFDMFFQNARAIGCKIASPLYKGVSLDFPLEEVLGLIDEPTKLIVICNPNNPTGTLLPLDAVEKIARKASDSIVYVDEAYYEFSGISAVDLIKKYPNIIISRTFSKAFGLAALRVGYVLADSTYINEMLKVRSPYPVNMAGYNAALTVIGDTAQMKSYADEVMNKAKPLVEEFFSKNNITYYPSSANFILFKPNEPEKTYEKLSDAHVLVRPQSKPGIEGTLRLTIGTEEQMKRFCEIYKKEVLNK